MTPSNTVQQPDWLRLDTAAIVYPPSRRRNWLAQFRFSATLFEEVDSVVLNAAAIRSALRYPAYNVKIRKGFFWHYLKKNKNPPPVLPDGCCPCEPLRPEQNGGFSFRVRYYKTRISVEFFHALTDGTGALSFLKTLTAEYISLKYGISIPRGGDLLDCDDAPSPEEYENSFKKYAGKVTMSRSEKTAFRVKGRYEEDGFVNLICGVMPIDALLLQARERGVTLTQFLAGVMLLALSDVQRMSSGFRARRRVIKVSIPINLRPLFPSITTRNFSSYVNLGIDPRHGEYSLDEAIAAIHYQMGAEATKKKLQAKFTTNVRSEMNRFTRFVPLFIKSPFLKAAFHLAGDRKNSATITNMGSVILPPEMEQYVERFEVINGPLSVNPVVSALISYRGKLYFNITRTITEPHLERAFFTRLVKLGIPVKIETNKRF